MLIQGFLGKISDYVSEMTFNNAAMEKAEKDFGLEIFLKNKVEMEEGKIMGMFSEWLVFDYKQSIFDGLTGLEYFTKNNPLHLSDEELNDYKNLLEFEVGLFEVKEIEMGRGILLESIGTGNKYFVNDVNASLSVKPESFIWVRISAVNRIYYIVSSSLFIMPFNILSGMRIAISKWKKNLFDAKEVAALTFSNKKNDLTASIREKEALSYEDAEKRFALALKKCQMDMMFSAQTYKKWIIDEKNFGFNFTMNALIGLMPTNVNHNDTEELLNASEKFANAIPRKKFGGKTPDEVSGKMEGKEKNIHSINIYSRNKYIEKLDKAHEMMQNGKFEKTYEIFEEVIKDLLADRMPFYDVFRIYANAGSCINNDDGYAEEIIEASLRINPLYDFGLEAKQRFIISDDFTNIRKGFKKFAKNLKAVIKDFGIKKYRKSVFYKYEKFLIKSGVSMKYETSSVHTFYKLDKDGKICGKIGRNDPCPCGSGKKYKKCCGK